MSIPIFHGFSSAPFAFVVFAETFQADGVPAVSDALRSSLNPSGTDYGAAIECTTRYADAVVIHDTFFLLFTLSFIALVAALMWVYVLEERLKRRAVITAHVVRQCWMSMRVFAALWIDSERALRGGSSIRPATSVSAPQHVEPLVPLPDYRVPALSGQDETIEQLRSELFDAHQALDALRVERDDLKRSESLRPQEQTSVADVISENDALAKENMELRNGLQPSTAMQALSRRAESTRVARNRLAVECDSLRARVAELELQASRSS